MAKKTDYKNQSHEELRKVINTKREELRSLRFNYSGSKNRDVNAAMKLRREIARALTALNNPSTKPQGK